MEIHPYVLLCCSSGGAVTEAEKSSDNICTLTRGLVPRAG